MDLLFLTLIAIGGVIFVNGWTDAPTAITACVTSGALPLRQAAMMAAFCNLLGIALSVTVHPAVAATVQNTVRLPQNNAKTTLAVLLSALAATAIWSVFAGFFGIPTSESHGLLAGLSGGAAACCGLGAIVGRTWYLVLLGLLISLFGGALFGFVFCAPVGRWIARGSSDRQPRGAIIFGAAAMAFLHGAQDGQKFIGLWLLATSQNPSNPSRLAIPILCCAALMGTGTLLGGKKIIYTLGESLVRAGYKEGIAADIGATVCLIFLTALGIPVSTTHTKSAALLGAGLAGGEHSSLFPTARKLALAWILTFPICFALAFSIARFALYIL